MDILVHPQFVARQDMLYNGKDIITALEMVLFFKQKLEVQKKLTFLGI